MKFQEQSRDNLSLKHVCVVVVRLEGLVSEASEMCLQSKGYACVR